MRWNAVAAAMAPLECLHPRLASPRAIGDGISRNLGGSPLQPPGSPRSARSGTAPGGKRLRPITVDGRTHSKALANRLATSPWHDCGAEEVTPLERGDRVVDVVSCRRGCALAVNQSHCKVRFDPVQAGWKPEVQGATEILPIWRLHPLTARWEGMLSQTARPELGGWRFARLQAKARGSPTPTQRETPRIAAGAHTGETAWPLSAAEGFSDTAAWCVDADLDTLLFTEGAVPESSAPLPPLLRQPSPSQMRTEDRGAELRSAQKCEVRGGAALEPPILTCAAVGSYFNEKPLPPPRSARQSYLRPLKAVVDMVPKTEITTDEGEALFLRFKAVAAHKFSGNLYGAWRIAMDVRNTGRCAFGDVVRAGRSFGFTGNFRLLWKVLLKRDFQVNAADSDRTRGAISISAAQAFEASQSATLGAAEREGLTIGFAALDPEAARMIRDFRDFVQARDMTLEDLWEDVLDPTGSGFCFRDHFCEQMGCMGWDIKKAKTLFHMFDVGGEQDISVDELELVGLDRRRVPIPEDEQATPRELRRRQVEEASKNLLQSFIVFLNRRFGTIVRAWRLGLDIDGDGRLRFQEFCFACKALGFRAKLRTLWKALDHQKTGYVCLKQLDAEASELMENFTHFLEDSYRTLDDVWERVFDSNGSGRVMQEEFQIACRDKLRWTGNAAKLFKILDVNRSRDLSLDEVEFVGMRRRAVTSKSKKEIIQEREQKHRLESQAMLQRFRAFLTLRYGTCTRAWRKVLDPDGDGKLQFTEFCVACRSMGFQGNMKALWLSLDSDDTGFVELRELDPDAEMLLDKFAQMLRIFFVDLDTAWHSCLDADGSGKCDIEEFIHACWYLGLGADKLPHVLFKNLDIDDRSFLLLRDLEVLKLPRAPSKEHAVQFANDSGDKARQEFGNFLMVRFSAPLASSWRLGFCSNVGIEDQLSRQLTTEEFCDTLHSLGFSGNYYALWFSLVGTGATQGGSPRQWDSRFSWAEAHLAMSAAKTMEAATSQLKYFSDGSSKRLARRSSSTGTVPVNRSRLSVAGDSPHLQASTGSSRAPSSSSDMRSTQSARRSSRRRSSARRMSVDFLEGFNPVLELGMISLKHVAPDVWKEVLSFRRHCMLAFETNERTWKELLLKCFHSDVDTRLRKIEFVMAAKKIGFSGHADLIYEVCDLKQEAHLSAKQFSFLCIGNTFQLLHLDMSEA